MSCADAADCSRSAPMCERHSHGGPGGHAAESGDSRVLSATLSGGEGEEVGVDGLHAKAADHSQCDAEEWNAVAGGGESAGLIFKTVAAPPSCPIARGIIGQPGSSDYQLPSSSPMGWSER